MRQAVSMKQAEDWAQWRTLAKPSSPLLGLAIVWTKDIFFLFNVNLLLLRNKNLRKYKPWYYVGIFWRKLVINL